MKKHYLLSILLSAFLLVFSSISANASNAQSLDLSGFAKIAKSENNKTLSYENGVVSITVPDIEHKKPVYPDAIPVDISAYLGRHVMLTMDINANCTPIDPSKKSSIIALLVYKSAGKTHYSKFWNQSNKGWCECALILDKLPQDAKNARLVLGLSNMKGELQFKNAKFNLDESAKLWEPLLPPNFKCEYTDSFKNLPHRRGASTRLRLSEHEIKKFKSWGGNLLRMAIGGAPGDERFNFTEEHERILKSPEYMKLYDEWFEKTFAIIKKELDMCAKHGVKVAIVLGSYPGFRYGNKDLCMFREKRYADKFVAMWKRIATELKGHKGVWCYDLINEPIQTRPYEYDAIKLQYMAAKAIREVDPETAVCVAAIEWSNPKGFKTLYPLPLKNIIYTAHMYMPHTHTHYNVGERPVWKNPPSYPDAIASKKYLEEKLMPIVDFQKKWNAQIYIGEFSCVRWLKGADKYIADCIDIFEKHNWHWSYHSFCESPVWNVEYDSNKSSKKPSKVDTPSKKVLLNAYSKNTN